MDQESELIAKDIDVTSPTPEGNVQFQDKSSVGIVGVKHDIKFTYDTSEDSDVPSAQPPKTRSLATKKSERKHTRHARATKVQSRARKQKKQKSITQPGSSSQPRGSSPDSKCPALGISDGGFTTDSQSTSEIPSLKKLLELLKAAYRLLSDFLMERSLSPGSSISQDDFLQDFKSQASLAASAVPISSNPYSGREDSYLQPRNHCSQPLHSPSRPSQPSNTTIVRARPVAFPEASASGALSVPPNLSSPALILRPDVTGRNQSVPIENVRCSPKFRRIDRIWDTSSQTFRFHECAMRPGCEIATPADDCIFIVRRCFAYNGALVDTFVELTNGLFKECVQEVMKQTIGVSLGKQAPMILPRDLFLWNTIRAKRSYLRLLIDYLEDDFSETEKNLCMMLEMGIITFDLLWALLKPNTLMYSPTYRNHDIPNASMLVNSTLGHNPFSDNGEYYLWTKYIDFDGNTLVYKTLRREIPYFTGAVKVSSLPFYPLQYHEDEEGTRDLLINRGAKFMSLKGVHCKAFSGAVFSLRSCGKDAATVADMEQCRIMIDPAAFRIAHPGPPAPKKLSPVRMFDVGSGSNDIQLQGLIDKLSAQTSEGVPVTWETHLSKEAGEKTKHNLFMICSPLIVGYSIARLDWFQFDVSGIGDVEWNDEAWCSLVLDQDTKEVIRSSVASHVSHMGHSLDSVVPTTRRRLTILLQGPPGIEKTQTVEALGDHLRRAVITMSARDLGSDFASKVFTFKQLLAICGLWGAIAVIDEADALLGKGSKHGAEHNAISQALESFQGIIFLTSSSVQSIDKAYKTRIDLTIKYGKTKEPEEPSSGRSLTRRRRFADGR
ncbi:aaa family atpase [Trichoderma arundinaceum]|uniref:Aaa family atpase n=1 Tax=Trichoderma arundinaceum TaxID=490622 RepID=A0A395NL49_TRIAR|nr:aaa family atpase [Trichoderma arundinaceum]